MTLSLAQWTKEQLEQHAWHVVSVARVVELFNPLEAWPELHEPIGKEEVMACLERGEEALSHTPSWTELALGKVVLDESEVRRRHVAKIAYFVRHDIQQPIGLEVGIPSKGYFTDGLVDDGNHRLAGAWIRGLETISAQISGEIAQAKKLGLWKPNRFERELQRRWREERQNQTPSPTAASSVRRRPGP